MYLRDVKEHILKFLRSNSVFQMQWFSKKYPIMAIELDRAVERIFSEHLSKLHREMEEL